MNILTSRRSFLFGISSLSLAGCIQPGGVLSARPRLKFGVVSDIHITDWDSAAIFRKTLRHFRDEGVDAVMIVGDMADHGILPQLENVARSWYEVFPNDKAPDGRHVEKLFVYGNHDPEGLQYRDAAMDKAFAVHHLTYEEAAKLTLPALGLDKCWEKCFHEKYEPIYIKNVKGYDFIGAHWDTWSGVRGLEDWFKNNISRVNTNQPFFYYQHCTPHNTIYGADSWGDDAGQSVRALSPYRNAVAFSGHSHRPLTDGRSYWRGEFTSIGTSTLSYVCLPGGRLGAPNHREKLDCRHGQIVSVYDDYMAICRRDFIRDENMDDVLVFDLPTTTSTFTARAVSHRERPDFPKKAKIKVSKDAGGIKIAFPGAFENPTARPFEYRINYDFAIPPKKGGKKNGNKHVSRKWFQPDAEAARARAAAQEVVIPLPKKDVPTDALSVKVWVTPYNCYGGEGETISQTLELG